MVSIDDLGGSPQSVIRLVVSEFRNRGWHDDGYAAIAIARRLASSSAETNPIALARVIPDRFLAQNHVSRTDVARALGEIAGMRR